MIINMTGGGGGGGLNFKVVQYAETPTGTAAENTIGVVTDTAILGWVMQAEQPTGTEGLVWIEVAAKSEVPFYADKKQTVKLYPKSVRQYVGGDLANIEAYVYQNGEWVQFSHTIFLAYNYGYESVAWTVGTNTTKGESSINYSGNIGGSTGTYKMLARTASPIDLTNLYSINILCDLNLSGTTNGYKYFGIRKDATPDGKDALMYTAHSNGQDNGDGKIISFNVMNLEGSYYIMVSAQTLNGGTGDGTFAIHKVWGEYIDGSGIVFLYDDGVEDADITGGWSYSGAYTKNTDSVIFGNGWDVGRMHTNNMVDVSAYTKLFMTFSATNATEYGGIGLTQTLENAQNVGSADGNSWFISKRLNPYVTIGTGNTSKKTITLDLDSVTGSYYIAALSGNNGNADSRLTVHKIWLE